MTEEDKYPELKSEIIQALKDVYDPEIPLNIYELGLIYNIDIDDDKKVTITMTLTAPNCPVVDSLLEEIEYKVESVPGVKKAEINITFDPPWGIENLSEEAKLELGLL